MNRERKIELVKRSLGLKHKLKVHDTMKPPESHDDLAVTTVARWDLEDELHAIDDILSDERRTAIAEKRKQLLDEGRPVNKKKK